MKKYLIIALSAFILSQACNKDNDTQPPLTTIPDVPPNENQKAVSGETVNNNGIVYTKLKQELSYNKFFTIDVDNNGRNDFYFTSVLIYQGYETHKYLIVSPLSTSGAFLQLDAREELEINGMWANPLEAGTLIMETPVENAVWNNYLTKGVGLDVVEKATNRFKGPWVGRQDKYLGMLIRIDRNVHYGWIRISHTAGEERLMITGYAYNTVVSEAIKAGQAGR